MLSYANEINSSCMALTLVPCCPCSPGAPGSPMGPGVPCRPGSPETPGCPLCPAGPFSPRSPAGPDGPDGPCNQSSSEKKIVISLSTEKTLHTHSYTRAKYHVRIPFKTTCRKYNSMKRACKTEHFFTVSLDYRYNKAYFKA